MHNQTEHIGLIIPQDLRYFAANLAKYAQFRAQHPHKKITAVTSKPMVNLALHMPFFDTAIALERPPFFKLFALWRYHRAIQKQNFDQYLRIDEPSQLSVSKTDHITNWANAPIEFYNLPERYALICLEHNVTHHALELPKSRLATFCKKLDMFDITPVLIGQDHNMETAERIKTLYPQTRHLCGQLNLFEIASIAKNAQFCLGHNTGMHYLCAAMTERSLCLFDSTEDTEILIPQGKHVAILQDELKTMRLDDIFKTLEKIGIA